LILLADEVHTLGANDSKKILTLHVGARMGLSATVNRANDSGAANWDDDTLSYYEMKKAINDKEITKVQNEFYSMQSNETLVGLLESNEQLCYQIRRQNPNNQDYRLD